MHKFIISKITQKLLSLYKIKFRITDLKKMHLLHPYDQFIYVSFSLLLFI